MGSTLSFYQSMGELSQRMASAARAEDWDELGRLEQELAAIRDHLQRVDPPLRQATLPEAERQIKVKLIRQILADDREIRAYAQPWMERVRGMLATNNRQRAVNATYGLRSG